MLCMLYNLKFALFTLLAIYATSSYLYIYRERETERQREKAREIYYCFIYIIIATDAIGYTE